MRPEIFGGSEILVCGSEETQVSPSDFAEMAALIHGSLLIDEILLGCLRIFRQHFSPRRLSLVQERANADTVTLYSVDDDSESPLILPRVIALRPSRLGECIKRRLGRSVVFSHHVKPDHAEKEYLVCPGASAVIYLPLLLGEKLKGLLALSHSQRQPLTPSQSVFLEFLAPQLSLALENSDTHYYERRRGRQLQVVSEIARQAVLLEDLSEFLKRASELLRQGFDYDAVQIWTLGSRQELVLRGAAYKVAPGIVNGSGMPSMVKECRGRNELIWNNNVSSGPKKTTSYPNTASQLAAPIRLRGKFLGILSVETCRLDAFSAEDFGIMEGMASLIASTFDNLRMFEHTQQSNEYMQAIMESAKDSAILSTDLQGFIITGSASAQTVFGIPQQEILRRNISTLFTDRRFQRELSLYINAPGIPTLERSALSQAVGESVVHLDVLAQRVCDAENRPIGFLWIIRDVTEHLQLQQTLESLSFTDELTGLYNQRRFFIALTEEIERSRRYHRKFSLCFFDMDGFKQYNDTRGHLRGDQAIRETANLLRTMVRGNVDTCYRYGGDEFTIIMPETVRRNARIVVERIRSALHEYFQGQISASIGIAEFDGAMSVEQIVERADRAMYVAKSQGGNCVVLGS